MKRAPIIEDWSRFNRAVLEIADGPPQRVAQSPPVSQQPKREPTEQMSGPGAGGDIYGLIVRQKWRKHA